MTSLRRLLLACLLALAAVPALAQNTARPEAKLTAGAAVPDWVVTVPIPDGDLDRPMVQILSDTQFRAGEASETYVHKVLVAHDISALASIAQLSITYVPDYQTVQLHQISLVRGGERLDRTASAQIRVLQREIGLEQGVYSGEATVSVLIDDVRVGDRVEYAYSTKGSNPIFGRRFIEYASWELPFPTVSRRVMVRYPADRHVRWRMIGDASVTPQETTADGQHILLFSAQNMAERPGKADIPADYPYFSWLQFAEYDSWSDIGAWADDLFRVSDDLPDELRRVVERLRTLPGDEARAMAALEYVQSEIRYFSVAFGESSHRPTAPAMVLERRFGDCKDKSLLLLTILKALGIEARPVLVNARRTADLDRLLPSPLAFDHVLVQITLAGKLYYLDPVRVAQHGRLDRIGNATAGAAALAVRATGAMPLRLPAPVPEQGEYDITLLMKLPEMDGPGSVNIQRIWRGVSAEAMRAAMTAKPKAEIAKAFRDEVDKFYGGAIEQGEAEFVDDTEQNVFTLTENFTVPKLATKADFGWTIRFNPINFIRTLPEKAETDRKIPLAMSRFPYAARLVADLELPETVRSNANPSFNSIDGPGFRFHRGVVFRGNHLRMVDDLALLTDRLRPDDLLRYNADYAELDRQVRGAFVISKVLLESASPSPKIRSLEEDSRERHLATLANLTRSITEAEAAGNRSDLTGLYCNRSYIESDLGQADAAMRDADRVIKLDPRNAAPWACRASAFYATGDFAEALSDYNHAMAINPADHEQLFRRGMAQYFLGNYKAAVSDFQTAISTARTGQQIYRKLWLALALARQGKRLPDALLAEAKAGAAGEWPSPALAMLAGLLPVQTALAPLEAKSGDDRALGLTEGEFYAAELDLIHHDTASAKRRLQRVIGFGAFIFTEYVAARHELRRLEAKP